MIMLLMAALSVGACAFTFALWATGYGGADSRMAARLGRLRGEEEMIAPQSETGSNVFQRKRRSVVTFGSFTLVPGKMAAAWSDELSRAGLTLHVKEYFILRLGVGAVAAFLAYALAPVAAIQMIGALVGAGVGFFLPAMFVKTRVSGRRAKMEAQVLELLPLVASALRSGFGLVQALSNASEQMSGPLRVEMDHMLRDVQVGASIEDAFESLRERVGSSDFDIVVTAILIQRSVGGNLANILDGVAETMRERNRIRGEIKALTAQQRMTGYVIGALPVGMFALFWFLNPEFEKLLFITPVGRILLTAAVTSEVVGFLVILKIVKIEV